MRSHLCDSLSLPSRRVDVRTEKLNCVLKDHLCPHGTGAGGCGILTKDMLELSEYMNKLARNQDVQESRVSDNTP